LGWVGVTVELLIAVIFVLSVVVNAALLLWVYKADHSRIAWPRRTHSAADAMPARRAAEGASAARRRPLYVAERGGVSHETTMSYAAALSHGLSAQGGRTIASPPSATSPSATPPSATSHSAILPPELAELLSRPAVMAPEGPKMGVEFGADVLARVADTTQGGGASRLAVDPLTGLEGPASWSRIVEIENARLLRYRRPVTVVMAEVEGLRRLTDRLGEEPVDRLLPVIADVFRREARSSDWVARLGAGRFAAFLPETDEIRAINYVERIRVCCEPWLAASAVPLRLAIGWSSPGASVDLEHAIGQAEERMHGDRRVPGKSPQPPRPGPARVVSLAAGSPATEGLSDLTETSVAPAETGRSSRPENRPVGASEGGIGPAVERL
jgi:diguanylate cyclase (GGDEF)-like protein